VLGEIAPLWNDYGPNATVYSETFYAWRRGIPALADKQWGGNLTAAELDPLLAKIRESIPGQNLERRIQSATSVIMDYTFAGESAQMSNVRDVSGNKYDGTSDCLTSDRNSLLVDDCTLVTPLFSKGRDYKLTVSMLLSSLDEPTNATLISGRDSTLMLTPNVTLFQGGNYYRLNTSLPLHSRIDLEIIGRGNQTFAKLNNRTEEQFLTKMGINGARFEWGPMAIEAPVHQLGGQNAGWSGEVFALKLESLA
jgi:hexosaminidase